MVDVVISLKYSGMETQEEKPVRILQLSKTRYQISRPGVHVFHFSGNSLHISPQLPSQIDKTDIKVRPLPSYKYYINFFKKESITLEDVKNKNTTKLVLWNKSQILLHGYGSSGKAGLALYLLMYPLKERTKEYHPNIKDRNILKKRKVLVVSLLYPGGYYEKLIKKIRKKEGWDEVQDTTVEYLCFYSGYLTPEDFINKILIKLDMAILNGEPFTGILLDGLHNASLQFPKLRVDNMVWSSLFSLLPKYHLTIVTTYTNFKIEKEIDTNMGILLKEDKFLLDLMIQSSDYYLNINVPSNNKKEPKNIRDGIYAVTLKSAIRHTMKREEEIFYWDREKMILIPKSKSDSESKPTDGEQLSIDWNEEFIKDEFDLEEDN
jgi:hypothetical protein